jgi:hypothetical protein
VRRFRCEVRRHMNYRKNDRRALVWILQRLAAAEIANALHLRDFRSPAIFEFLTKTQSGVKQTSDFKGVDRLSRQPNSDIDLTERFVISHGSRARTRKTCAKPAHRYSPDLLPETTGRMSCVGRQAIGVRVASRSVAASTIWRRVAFESRFRARPGSAPFGHPSPSPRQSRHSDRGARGSYL